jgi:hypothetical protein
VWAVRPVASAGYVPIFPMLGRGAGAVERGGLELARCSSGPRSGANSSTVSFGLEPAGGTVRQ